RPVRLRERRGHRREDQEGRSHLRRRPDDAHAHGPPHSAGDVGPQSVRTMSEIRIGSFRVEETLGTGALATISRAVQDPVGRVVALKALKTQIAPGSSFAEQLEREAKVLSDLVHPNVVLLL